MYGYVLQHGNDNIDIGDNGTKLVTESYSFAMYGTKLRDNHFFTDGIIGVSLLDIDHKRITYGNTLKGNREGQQIFCLVFSNSRDFSKISALSDAWLPSQRLWVGEYPFLLRPAFEELCQIRLR